MKSVFKSRILRALGQRTRIARVIVAVAFAGLFTAACKDSTSPRTVTALTIISPTSPQTIPVNGTVQFTVQAKNADGDVLAVTPTWSIVSGGGTISSTGLFTAGTTPGTTVIAVTCSGITVNATITVTAGSLFAITVAPDTTLVIGATAQFRAVGRDALGNVVAITPVWSTVNPPGTIIAATGLFTAGNTIGSFPNSVQACVGAICDQANVIVIAGPLFTITVTPNPDTLAINTTQQFAAVGKDAGGNVVPIPPPLVWSVVNGGGSIDANTGLFTAGGATGTFPNTVKATSGTVFGTATVVVTAVATGLLGSASGVGILAGSTVTCVTGGVVNADIDIYAGSALVGFGPCVLTGVKHLADPVAQQAQADLLVAYNTLAGLPCPGGNVIGTADIGGTTKAAGVYCSGSTIGVTGNLTLDGGGDPNATFVFQAGSSLTGVGNIILINGAQAKNVWWVNGAAATIGVGSAWEGNILAVSSITLNDNVTLLGRALTRIGAVTLGNNNVITLP
ncbi:MAG TPA: ice-binding family protein [Gemmatimonadaceae bacterium]